jgi:hypothetical protein
MEARKLMDAIEVQICEMTATGRLYPRYDVQTNILEVGSRVVKDWTYGVDIDGTIIFDLTQDRILANFDLLVPRHVWKVDPLLSFPKPSKEGCIRFSASTVRHKSFHLSKDFRTNANRSNVLVIFGNVDQNVVWIGLSEKCSAAVRGSHLVGFLVQL